MAITRIAIIRLGVGSVYGQAATEDEAIKIAYRQLKEVAKIRKEASISVAIYDYEPYSRIHWDGAATYGQQESDGKTVSIHPIAVVKLNAKGKVMHRTEMKPL